MHAAIDSVVMHHLLRRPRKSAAPLRPNHLDERIRSGRLVIGADKARAIFHEWERTCGPDIQTVLTKWAEWNGLLFVVPSSSLPRALRQCDERLRMRDTVDKLLVRIALALPGKTVVSIESD